MSSRSPRSPTLSSSPASMAGCSARSATRRTRGGERDLWVPKIASHLQIRIFRERPRTQDTPPEFSAGPYHHCGPVSAGRSLDEVKGLCVLLVLAGLAV